MTITVEALDGSVQVGDTMVDLSNKEWEPPPPLVDRWKTPSMDWFLSEPEPNDLMNEDARPPPQAADLRRMNWIFDERTAGRC